MKSKIFYHLIDLSKTIFTVFSGTVSLLNLYQFTSQVSVEIIFKKTVIIMKEIIFLNKQGAYLARNMQGFQCKK